MAVFMAPFDGDDAYYVVEALLANLDDDVLGSIVGHGHTNDIVEILAEIDFRLLIGQRQLLKVVDAV